MSRKKVNSIVFVSNYYSHHQAPLSEALFCALGEGYHFIETEPMSEERIKLGWGEKTVPSCVVSSTEFHSNREKYETMIHDADIVILGSAPASLLQSRIRERKAVFRYSERPLKEKTAKWKYPFRLITWRRLHPQRNNILMLCASAYTATDYGKFFLYKNNCYKWGYFPRVKKYDEIESLIEAKRPASIAWVARFIDWKHPEMAIEIAKRLKNDGYRFEMNMIGTGVLEDAIREKIAAENLDDCVHMLGSMKPDEVRTYMEKSEIFLFTSDRNEGWGAVLNESMNSACAVIANHAIGSVPFLVEDEKNGLIYKDKDADALYAKTKWLLEHESERKNMARHAYETMMAEWNAENAAKKLLVLAEKVINGEKCVDLFENGVCSKAQILKDNWKK